MPPPVRLAVGSSTAMHSAAWTIWTQGDELYAGQSSSRGDFKLSMHSSGICRWAWSKASGVALEHDPDPRVMNRWRVDPMGSAPWTQCFTLFVPTVFIPNRFDHTSLMPSHQVSIRWIPPAPLMFGKHVALFRAQHAEQDISEVLSGDYEVLDTLSLRSGGRVWIVCFDSPMSVKDMQWWQWAVSDMKVTYDELPDDALAVLMSPASDHPFPVIREVALGWNNLKSNGSPSS